MHIQFNKHLLTQLTAFDPDITNPGAHFKNFEELNKLENITTALIAYLPYMLTF